MIDRPTEEQLDLLVTTRGIAKRAHVSVSAVSNWKVRGISFPDPIYDRDVALYWWPQVHMWLSRTGRLK